MSCHTFDVCLAASRNPRVQASLALLYHQLWPYCIERIEYVPDSVFQASGRDVRVTLRGAKGRQSSLICLETLEEKIRQPGRSSQYNDLLVEVESNREQRRAGWLYTSQADWLVYVRQPGPHLHVLVVEMQPLKNWFTPRRARFDRDWIAKTRLPSGAFYHTVNKAIPLADPEFQVFRQAHGLWCGPIPLLAPPAIDDEESEWMPEDRVLFDEPWETEP